MIKSYTNEAGTTWRIVTSPTTEELKTLMTEMNIPNEYFEEISTPTPQPLCLEFGETTYAVFHVPIVSKKTNSGFEEAEVDVLIDSKTITTIIYTSPENLHIPIEKILQKNKSDHPAEMWWHILTEIYNYIHQQVDGFVVEVKGLREKVFTKREQIKAISVIHRAYLALDLALSTHEDIILSIHETEHPGAEKGSPRSWSKVQGEYHRLTQKLAKLGAYVHELRDTQNSLISAEQNRLTQTFTILAFIFLPVNFLAALFGMNVVNMPIVGHEQAFWILLGGFAFITFGMLIFFKIRKWL